MCIYIHIEKDIYVDAYISLYEYNLYEQIIFIIHAYLFICIRAEYGWGDTHKISMYKVLCCMGAKWTLGEHLEWCWFASPSIPIWHMGKGSHNSYGGHCINTTLLQSYFQEKVKVTQSCLTLYNPMTILQVRILQVRILEWVAVPFSKGSSQPRDRTQVFSSAGGFFTSWATNNPFHKDMILILVLEGVFVTFDSCACHISE